MGRQDFSTKQIGAFVFAAILLFGAGVAGASPGHLIWPQTSSDLSADPSITFGVLDNGLRYAIQHNATPPAQVSMRLVIRAGSMHESHDQEGLAHILEHMAFRGSMHVPDGEVAHALERVGLQVGADINAQTTRDLTIYKFDLARGDEASVETGLMLLREIASELLLDPKLMDLERKVVVAEAHTHSAAMDRYDAAVSAALYGDHPYARSPIGRTDVIETAPVGRLRDFYNAYYRPERAIVIVVGDIDPAAIEAKIAAKFAGWRGTGVAGADPSPMDIAAHGARFPLAAIDGLDSLAEGLHLFYLHPYHAFRDSHAAAVERMVYGVTTQAAQSRLIELNERAGKPFLGSVSLIAWSVPPQLARIDYTNAGFVSDWRGALDLLVKSRRQLLQFGLQQSEVDAAIALRRSGLEQWVAQGGTIPTPALASGLVTNVEAETVPLSPQQTLDLFNEAVAGLKADRATDVLRDHFAGDGPVVFYATAEAPVGGVAAIKDVYTIANTAAVLPYEPPPTKPWHYTDFGMPSAVVERRTIDDLGVTMVRFANGVRLTVKSTEFAKNQVLVTVRFGHGHLDLPRDKVGPSDFAPTMLNTGGLRDMTALEAGRSLLGKNVSAFAVTGEDAFMLHPLSPVTSDALDLEMQLLAAHISAPGWRTDDWHSFIGAMAHSDDANDASPMAVYGHDTPSLLHSGDKRWAMNTPGMRAAWKPEDAIAFIKPILETSPLEVIVVGDVTVDHAIDSVSRTFGALPARRELTEPPGLKDVKFPAPTATTIELHHNGAPFQALAVIAWPTTDGLANPSDTHASYLLATIMQERAREQMRNKEGKAYSPSVIADFSQVLPGYGAITASAQVEPADIASVFAEFDASAADLAAHEVPADEFARMVKPRIEGSERNRVNNGFWLNALAGAQTDPRRLIFAATQLEGFKSLTSADVRAAAQRWLVKEKSWRLMITPRLQKLVPNSGDAPLLPR